jgi:hypothetical protein
LFFLSLCLRLLLTVKHYSSPELHEEAQNSWNEFFVSGQRK